MIKRFLKKKFKGKAVDDSQLRKYKIQEILGAYVIYLYLELPKIEKESEGISPPSYFDSKYWLGIKPKNVKALVPFQLLSGIGAISWVYDIRKNPPESGILKEKIFKEPMYEILITTFLIGIIMCPLSLKQKTLQPKKQRKKLYYQLLDY